MTMALCFVPIKKRARHWSESKGTSSREAVAGEPQVQGPERLVRHRASSLRILAPKLVNQFLINWYDT
jgi:hypothetical protein